MAGASSFAVRACSGSNPSEIDCLEQRSVRYGSKTMIWDKMRTRTEGKAEDEQVNVLASRISHQRISPGSKAGKFKKPEKRQINGHEFDLILTTDNKSKAKREAKKCHKHGFHTRVVESCPGMFSVYRRPKQTVRSPIT